VTRDRLPIPALCAVPPLPAIAEADERDRMRSCESAPWSSARPLCVEPRAVVWHIFMPLSIGRRLCRSAGPSKTSRSPERAGGDRRLSAADDAVIQHVKVTPDPGVIEVTFTRPGIGPNCGEH